MINFLFLNMFFFILVLVDVFLLSLWKFCSFQERIFCGLGFWWSELIDIIYSVDVNLGDFVDGCLSCIFGRAVSGILPSGVLDFNELGLIHATELWLWISFDFLFLYFSFIFLLKIDGLVYNGFFMCSELLTFDADKLW